MRRHIIFLYVLLSSLRTNLARWRHVSYRRRTTPADEFGHTRQ
jgi:hypothetical protein